MGAHDLAQRVHQRVRAMGGIRRLFGKGEELALGRERAVFNRGSAHIDG